MYSVVTVVTVTIHSNITYLKIAETVALKCSHHFHKERIYRGNPSAISTHIKSLSCTPETYTMPYIKPLSIRLKKQTHTGSGDAKGCLHGALCFFVYYANNLPYDKGEPDLFCPLLSPQSPACSRRFVDQSGKEGVCVKA